MQQQLSLNDSVSDSRLIERLTNMGQSTARKFEQYNLKENKNFLRQVPQKRITIDMDSTVKSVYGNQQGASNGYNDKKRGLKSYHPILAFISNYKLAFHTWFRPGNAYTSNGSVEFTKQILSSIPDNIEKVFFRMDSGFFNNQLIQLIEDHKQEYLIKVKFKNMYKLFKTLTYYKTDNKHFDAAEINYPFEVEKEDGERVKIFRLLRVVRKIKSCSIGSFGEQVVEYEYFCYCSNLKGKTTLEIHETYCKRADCENWIEQIKNHLLAGSTLCNDFWANDIMWQLSVFAYNLSLKMRMKIKKYFRQEYNTFRDRFVNVAGQLTASA